MKPDFTPKLMNRFTLLFVLFCFSFGNLFAQAPNNKILIEEYIKQSENQKKTGLIMLGAGVGATLIGTVMFGSAWSTGSEVVGGSGVVLLTAGVISTLVSIPIIISSASKARKAAKLSIQSRSLPDIQPAGLSSVIYPALSLSIPINSK